MLVYKKKHFNLSLSRLIDIKRITLFTIIFLSLISLLLSSVYLGVHLYRNGTMFEMRSKIYAAPRKLKLEFNSYLNTDPKLYIDIGFKEFKRLEYTRKRNIKDRVASYSSDDWVPAKIKFDNVEYKVKIRLKGVYLDHWIDAYKWSFRIKIKEGRTLFGSSELSLQDPITRSYLLEWVFMKMLSDANLIHHRTQLSEVVLNGERYGLYMIHDQYSKYLIEYNKRREGPIIGFNKELYVSARQRDGDSDMASLYDSFYKAPLDAVTVTAKNDPKMINLAEKGIQMLESFRQGQIEAHQVFDYKALAKATAIRVLLGSSEFDWRDIKFYVNPISLKLEPVMREVHAYSDPTELTNWSTGHDLDQYQSLIFSDPIFFEEYLKELYTISRESFLKRFYEKHGKKLIELEAKINNFQDYKFPYEKIETRAKVIREKMNPTEAVNSYITNINKESVSLKISAVQPFASEIGCVTYQDNPILCPQNNFIVHGKPNNSPPKYKLVNMKWVATDFDIKKKIKEIYLNYNILGNPNTKKSPIRKWDIENVNISKELPFSYSNITDIDWITINHEKKIIKIASGEQIVRTSILFPKEHQVYVLPGTVLTLQNNANLLFQGPVFIEGEKDNPVIIQSKQEKGGGLLVLKSENRSKLNNVLFYGLSAPKYKDLNLSGSVTFYESDVDISNVIFNNNYTGDDYLNIIRSNFTIHDSIFKKILFDAVDFDFCDGLITNTVFEDIGNDALDFSGSTASIDNIIANNIHDKVISAGEESYITILDIQINNSNFGIVSKDRSKILANNIEFNNVNYIAAAYQKKSEFGPAKININNHRVIEGDSKFIVGNNSQINLGTDKILNNLNAELIKDIANLK